MQTRQQFVEEFRHEFGGLVLDALTHNLKGAPLSEWTRGVMRAVDAKLGEIWDKYLARLPAEANGHVRQ